MSNVKEQISKDKFGNGIGILARGVHHHNVVSCGSGKIDAIDACTSTNDDLQTASCVEHFGIEDVAAHDEGIGSGHGFE